MVSTSSSSSSLRGTHGVSEYETSLAERARETYNTVQPYMSRAVKITRAIAANQRQSATPLMIDYSGVDWQIEN